MNDEKPEKPKTRQRHCVLEVDGTIVEIQATEEGTLAIWTPCGRHIRQKERDATNRIVIELRPQEMDR